MAFTPLNALNAFLAVARRRSPASSRHLDVNAPIVEALPGLAMVLVVRRDLVSTVVQWATLFALAAAVTGACGGSVDGLQPEGDCAAMGHDACLAAGSSCYWMVPRPAELEGNCPAHMG